MRWGLIPYWAKDIKIGFSTINARWPDDRQHELAELALEIKAELADAGYEATPDELAAIDEGVAGEAASEEEVKVAFALFRRA